MRRFIPQIQPWIDEQELSYLQKVIDSTFVTENELTKEFEKRVQELTGAKYTVAYTNGTAALFGCFTALGIGPGDKVIVPNMTFVATANAVIMTGATPVFCEVDKKTFCIDPEEIRKLLDKDTKAIVPVHLYGQAANMDEILKIARENSLQVVEDAAQGVGVKYKNQHVGTLGDLGILSYYGNKTITCGEGGIILTNNKELRDSCYRIKNHGRDTKGGYIHHHVGYNFCFTDLQAAIGLAQMDKLQKIIDRKQKIYDTYSRGLASLSDVLSPATIDKDSSPVFWFTSYLSPYRDELQLFLKTQNIQTRDFFHPLHLQPCYRDLLCGKDASKRSFKISEKIFSEGISLPSSYNLKHSEQLYVIDCIHNFFNNKVGGKNDIFSK